MSWLEGWSHRIKCTIDGAKVNENLFDFPVMISLASGVGINSFVANAIFDELSPVSGTIFSEDFSSGMPNWTVVTGSGTVVSGYLDLSVSPTEVRSNQSFFFDENFDVTVSMKWNSSGWVWLGYVDFAFNSSNGNYALRIRYDHATTNGTGFSLYRRTGGSDTTIVSPTSPSGFAAGYWFHHRVMRNKNDLFWKVWRADTPEPNSWQYMIKNAFLGTEEKTGLIRIYSNSNFFHIDDISITKYGPMFPQKLMVTTSGNSACYTEIDYWDPCHRRAVLWTKLPVLSSGVNTEFYVYYDRTQIDNTLYVDYTGASVASSVWDSSFKAVYHFSSTPVGTLTFKDSTSFNNHGTPSTFAFNNINGYSAGLFYGFTNSQSISISDADSLDLVNNYTLEALVYPTAKHVVDEIICKADSDTTGYQLRGDNGVFNFYTGVGTAGNYPYNTNTWYYLAGTFSGTSVMVYVNGSLYHTSTASTSGTPTNTQPFYIGRRWDGNYFDGSISEIFVSSGTRSSNWIYTMYYNLWDNLIFYQNQDLPINICSGVVWVDNYLANNIPVRLYRRSTGELIDSTITSVSGNFTLGSPYLEDHYVVALYTTSGTNALIYDWIAP